MTITVELPFASPSGNEVNDWRFNPRTRAWKYRRFKDDVTKVLRFAIGANALALIRDTHAAAPATSKRKKPAPNGVRVRVVFVRHSGGELDDDNLRGGIKPIRDALKDLGVLVDDKSKWLEAEYRQVIVDRGVEALRKTVLEISW